MNMQPAPQSKSSSNGSPYKRGKREGVLNQGQSIKSHPENTLNTEFNGEAGSLKRHSRDSLVYLTTCKIGHLVEVHLKNGSIYSGIFHAADVEKDFGIILKMASLIKDSTLRGHKSRSDFVRKPPSKTFIIPADELVQVVAKDLSVSSDGILNAVQSEKPVELLTDSSISNSRHVGQGRELKPWVPDEDFPQPQGLENVFDEPCIRGWDQFKVNESMCGVTSTFRVQDYSTALEKNAGTKELEATAERIAREIEGETTRDRHVAEERGLQLNEKFDIDEETKYSAVRPVDGFDDSGFDEEDDKLLDTCNEQTFSGSSTSYVQKPASSSGQKPTSSSGKGFEDVRGDSQPSRNITNVDQSCSISDDQARHLPSEQRSKDLPAPGSSISESQLAERRKNNNPEVSHSNRSAEESVSGHGDIKEGAKSGGGETSASKTVASQVSGKTKPESSVGQSVSRSSEGRPGPSTPTRPLSPSSSIGSLSSSEKSTLNPLAKEFKPSSLTEEPHTRPPAPIGDESFYYPPHGLQMPRMPVGRYEIPPPYRGPPPPLLLYYPAEFLHPRPYYHPNAAPQYQQQQEHQQSQQQPVMLDQPRGTRPHLGYILRPPHHPENRREQ